MRLFKLEDWSCLREAADVAETRRDDTRRAFIEAAQAPRAGDAEASDRRHAAEVAYRAAAKTEEATHAALNAYNTECQRDSSPYERAYGAGLHDGEPLLTDSELTDTIRTSGLPATILDYLLSCMSERVWIPAVEAIRESPEEVISHLREIFLRTAQHADVPIEDLLKSIDFQRSNLTPTHLDTVLAIMRALNFLAAEGFSNIRPVKARQGTKTVDLIARRGERSYGFEVTCFTAQSDRPLGALRGDIVSKYDQKRSQLESALANGSATTGLIVVLNRDSAVNLGRLDEYVQILADAHFDIGSPADVHLVVVTGKRTAVPSPEGGRWEPDDCVFPPWK